MTVGQWSTFCVSHSQPSIQPYEGGTARIPTSQGSKLKPREGQPLTQSPTASLNVNSDSEKCAPKHWGSSQPRASRGGPSHVTTGLPRGLPTGVLGRKTQEGCPLPDDTESFPLCTQHLPHPHLRAPWRRSRARGGQGDSSPHCRIWTLAINTSLSRTCWDDTFLP